MQELSKEPESEKDKRIKNIKNLYAFELFCQRRFDESLTLFAKLGTGKSIKINICMLNYNLLFTELIPECLFLYPNIFWGDTSICF